MWALNIVTVVSGLVDGALACFVLFRQGSALDRCLHRRWPLRASDLLFALAVMGAALFLKCSVLVAGGLGFFGLVRIVYFDGVVVLPLIGLAILVRRSVRSARAKGPGTTRFVTAFAFAAILAAPIGYYATFVEPFDLRLEQPKVAIERWPAEAPCLRVGILADVQTDQVGDYEHRAVDTLMAQRPDVIVIPGDIYQGPAVEFPQRLGAFRALFAKLRAPKGVYIVTGDTDARDEIEAIIRDTAVQWLDDDIIEIAHQRAIIRLAGVNLNYQSATADAVYRRLAEGSPDAVRILFAHRPGAVAACLASGTRPDLVMAGHTHGGQVRIPGLGPIVTFSALPRRHAAGLSRYEGVPLYVSRGVGCERGHAPRIRLFCPPEITVLSIGRPTTSSARQLDRRAHDGEGNRLRFVRS